ncbi:solute carrier family 22 member 18 isoform X2 [Alligator mississippiensis]|uniref:solute carrier family 22 member 18 isoform X2 n=1 Tax=Alligator mississippiensis TaxID=8496 RepID=UPI002877819E|nr:solute carrier family 22 member 18 isoform X2 [Alligator mississippiensis]
MKEPTSEERNRNFREEALETHKPENMIQRQQVIRITYLITALDLTFLFMQTGIIPYLAKSLGLDSVDFGYLQTIFGVLQLLGGPVFGRFADQFGARAALTLSSFAGFILFLLLSVSTSTPLLFLSRIPAIFMHGLPGAQMVVTDLTPPPQRAEALGKLGLCFGVGMIIGSSLGGTLATKFGIYFPSYIALVGSLINTVIVMTCIPAHTKPKSEGRAMQPSLFLIMFSIISMDFFGLEAAESGYLLAYFGVLQMVIQGLVIGRLTSYYTERTLLMLGVVVFGGVGLALALMTNVFHYCIISLPMVFAFCTVGIITDSILTKAVPTSDTGYVRYSVITLLERKGEEAEGVSKHQANLSWSSKPCCSERRLPKKKSQLLCIQPSQKNIYNLDCSWIQLPTRFGAMLGICASVHPLMRTVGPTIGGLLYKQFGVSSFGYLQLAVNLVLFLYLSKNKIPPKEEKVQ